METEHEISRGQYGQELLSNPIFQEIWTTYSQQLLDALKALPPRDLEGMEKAVLAMKLLDNLKAMVEDTVATGKMAAQKLAQKQTLAERARAAVGMSG